MNKRRRKPLLLIPYVLVILIIAILIFLLIPYSKTKSEFNNIILNNTDRTSKSTENFTLDDIKDLPGPVAKHFLYCGLIGTPKMSYMKAAFQNVNLVSANKILKVNYTQYNFVEKPERFAYIESSLFGIPFEGFDSYKDGTGSMKGVIAKLFPIFDQRGPKMDKACLVTILAESLFIPNIALQDYIIWEEIDDTHAKATITCYGISASGIFTFNKDGAMIAFRTDDRIATDMDGSEREAEWSAIIEDYQTIDGIKLPKTLKAVWHFPEGDQIYFNENGSIVEITYY